MSKFIKKYMNCAIIYTILGLIGGVFYREFTKFNGFSGKTMLSVVHTHYLILGTIVFLLLVLFEKSFHFSDKKSTALLNVYQLGLNMTVIMFIVRGVLQVLAAPLSTGLNASISGIAGIGHIILGVSLVLLLAQMGKKIKNF